MNSGWTTIAVMRSQSGHPRGGVAGRRAAIDDALSTCYQQALCGDGNAHVKNAPSSEG